MIRCTILILMISFFIAGCRQASDNALPNMSFLNRTSVLEMRKGLLEAFPPGTPRALVEKALIKKGGAVHKGKISGMYSFPNETNVHSYRYTKPIYLRFLHDGSYVITVFYDENDLVKRNVITRDGVQRDSIEISGPTSL